MRFSNFVPNFDVWKSAGPCQDCPTYLGLVYIYGSKPNPTQVKQLIEVYNG